MIEERIEKNKSNFYAFSFFSLVFIAIFICAGLFVKSEFGGGVKLGLGARPKAPVPAPSEIAGRYVGFTTISTGICSVGAHEFVLEIDDEDNVKSSYGMKPDKFLTGRINSAGWIKLSFRDNGFIINFEGELHAAHITGHSTVTGDRTCDITWDLWRS
jgi:hypothetical protein